MIQFKKIIKATKDKKILTRHIVMKIGVMIITSFFLAGMPIDTADAVTGLKIYNYTTKKTTTYMDKQIKATLNGATIGSSKYPGILVNGTALLPYYDIFASSSIAADCSYSEKTGNITISKYGKKIEMKIGSKNAKVNGKSYTMPVAPVKVKYVSANTAKVLVPSRFVSENLGLGYTWYSNKNTVAITKSAMQLSYNGGKKFDYTGATGKVTIDGKSINLGKTPSIIIENTAMLSAYKVFASADIDADYTYNKSNQKVTLVRDDKVLEMTIGSKTAYLNKKPLTLSAAPIYVTNYETNTSYVMVPGSITASSLGFDYRWNNTTRTSIITSRNAADSEDNSQSDTPEAPELGDSGDISETGTILGQWSAPEALYGISNGTYEINTGDSVLNQAMINSVTRDYNNARTNSETYLLQASSPFSKITSTKSGNIITLISENTSCMDQSYPFYGISSNLINKITTYNQGMTSSSRIDIELLQENCQYDIALSPDKQQLSITVYTNALTSATVGTNDTGDYLVLNGISPLNASITEMPGLIYIDLPHTVNYLWDLNVPLQGSKYIKQLFSTSTAEKTQIVLSLNAGYQYYKQENGNQLTLSFLPGNGGTSQPDLPPLAEDTGKYEITLPKPEGVTSSMITDEDFYYNHYFVVKLQGDYTSLINTNSIINNSNTVSKIDVSLDNSGNTVIKISTTKLQGYLLAYDNDNIYIDIGNPRDIYKNIVVLDPGHGGTASGTIKNGTYEKNINLQILYTIGKKYFNQDASKLKIYYTRTSDVDMSLKDRAAFASKVGADLFVSLHMNSAQGAPNANGTEVYYSHNNNSANPAGLTSEKFASYFKQNIVNALGTNDRGVKENEYVVIDINTVPAVLIELGFLSNTSEFAMIMDEANQVITVETIYNTLLEVFEKYPTGR